MNNKGLTFVLVFLLIVSIGINLIQYYNITKEDTVLIETKALLDAQIYAWGYNEDNLNELLFQYSVYNYGDVEVKEIEVTCSLFKEGITLDYSSTDNFGNLASKSVKFGEFTPPKPDYLDYDSKYSPVCYVRSCKDCEILYERIPELTENYK